MQAFSLLVDRPGGGGGGGKPYSIRTTAIAAFRPSTDTGGEEDDGPFFELELPSLLPRDRSPSTASDSDSTSERSSDGIFFKGGLFSLDLASLTRSSSEPGSKATTHCPSSLLRSATMLRLRAFKLSRKKPVPSPKESNGKCIKPEEVPLASFFTRDISSRSSGSWESARLLEAVRPRSPEDKKTATHQAIQKYLKKIKPFNVRVFARRGARQVGPLEGEPPSRPAGLLVVARRLRKNRSPSSAVEAPPPLPRRDDTLLEKQVGIQSAIDHCKQSLINRVGATVDTIGERPGRRNARGTPSEATVLLEFSMNPGRVERNYGGALDSSS